MTQKIARFLSDHQPATPCLVVDVDRVEGNFRRLRRALPLARVYYAVKANPAAPILERLVGLDSSFDAASIEEIRDCLAAGSRVYCRLLVENDGAEWPLSRKFGTSVDMARELMVEAAARGLDPYGLSFHVGSQQTRTNSYEAAIGKVAMLFTDLAEAGVNLRMVNLGGGFPIRYDQEVPGIDTFATAIMGAMTRHFGNALPEMVIEPGRFLVGDAGVVSAEVVLVSRKSANDPVRWVYLDIGRFGGLAETEGEAVKYRMSTPHDGSAAGPVVIAGPTCDGADIMYERSNYRLPTALACGDRIELHDTGAYVTTYASQRFNGFAPLAEHYI